MVVEVTKSVKELGHNASSFRFAELLAFYNTVEEFSSAYTARWNEEGVRRS